MCAHNGMSSVFYILEYCVCIFLYLFYNELPLALKRFNADVNLNIYNSMFPHVWSNGYKRD